jgi:hypothetical protein
VSLFLHTPNKNSGTGKIFRFVQVLYVAHILPLTTMVFEILETKLNKMIFHAYKSSLRINVEQTDRAVSSVYNDFERVLNRPEFKSWSEEIF